MALPSPVEHLPLPIPHEKPAVPHLQPVPSTSPRPRRSPLALAIICVISLLGILSLQLWLSVATSAGAYVTDELIVQERELLREERAMQQRVDMFASPQHLSEEASSLGMVQNARPAYLKLEDQTLVGDLNQQSQAPRTNVIANAALSALTAAPVASHETTEDATGKPEPVTPQGPLPWDGILQAPQTR